MPSHKSPKKHMRADARKRLQNRGIKSQLKAVVRRLSEAPDAESAEKVLPEAYSALDRAAKRNTIPKRTADRRKARLAKRVARTAAAAK